MGRPQLEYLCGVGVAPPPPPSFLSTTYGQRGFQERARVSGERPMGAARFRQQSTQHHATPPPPRHTQYSLQAPEKSRMFFIVLGAFDHFACVYGLQTLLGASGAKGVGHRWPVFAFHADGVVLPIPAPPPPRSPHPFLPTTPSPPSSAKLHAMTTTQGQGEVGEAREW